VADSDAVPEAFGEYWRNERQEALANICKEENLAPEKVEKIINKHLFTEITPLRDDVVHAMMSKPKLLQRKPLAQRALDRIMDFIETFIMDAPE
jgi:type I restriction enzyme R subunit